MPKICKQIIKLWVMSLHHPSCLKHVSKDINDKGFMRNLHKWTQSKLGYITHNLLSTCYDVVLLEILKKKETEVLLTKIIFVCELTP